MDSMPDPLKHPLVVQALKELQTSKDGLREQYEARRKFWMDIRSAMDGAREEGREEGLLHGEKIGIIHLCERLLNRSETPAEQLVALSLAEVSRLAEELQASLARK